MENNKFANFNHDNIIEYFSTLKCNNCPFKKECDSMYDTIRMYTTSAFTLCAVFENRHCAF